MQEKRLSSLILEWGCLALIIIFFLLRLFYKFYFTPDSSFYYSAANNFVQHGTLFVYSNWPSRTMIPGIEYYADYAPGFPLYLSAFILFFKDALWGAAIAQAVALTAMFLVIYKTTKVLEIKPILALTMLCFLGVFAPHRISLQALLTEPLFLFLCFAVFLSCVNLMVRGDSRIRWLSACILLFLASAVRWNGFACAGFFILPIFHYRQNWLRKIFFVGLASGLPILLWFIRNKIMIGKVSAFYGPPSILYDRLPVPFLAMVKWWGHGSVVLTLLIFLLSILPILIAKVRKSNDLRLYAMVWLGCIVHFLVIYGLSLITMGMTPIDDRYLMPTYFLFSCTLFFSLDLLLRSFHMEKLAAAVLGLLFLAFLPKAVQLIKTEKFSWVGVWSIPPEQALWQEIKKRPYYKAATHFYSEEWFSHQAFAEKPQRIFWNVQDLDAKKIRQYFATPGSPFMIVSKGSALQKLFDLYFEPELANLGKENFAGFTVYYLSR